MSFIHGLRLSLIIPVAAMLSVALDARRAELPLTVANPNTSPAGVLRDGVLDVAMEAKPTAWRIDGEGHPALTVEAFAEEGKSPLMPGPLVRVPKGTEIRMHVRNSLTEPISLLTPAAIHGATVATAMDTVVIAPGELGEILIRATVPGSYIYRGTTSSPASKALRYTGLLAGAIVVDTSAVASAPRDRVLVMMMTADSVATTLLNGARPTPGTSARIVFSINGESWPRTERISATVGDSLHWRIINASNDVHPMHLHGFYFRVDEVSGPSAAQQTGEPGRMVVTERMLPFSSMSMTWAPERAGNWLFHCHFADHNTPHPAPDADPHAAHDSLANHALTGMAGLVLGVNVAPRPGAKAASVPRPDRRLRLVAVLDSGFTKLPSMRFVLEDLSAGGKRTEAGPGFSPTIYLERGKPVSITVVNQLTEMTAVHWHGIELESYNDGVPGFSGAGDRISPIIQPRDSFEVHFTPPRSGTFMYHSHVDEVRQQMAGLEGALIVRDAPGSAPPANDDYMFFIKAARDVTHPALPLEINGTTSPDTVVMHAGRTARLRFASLTQFNPNATVSLTARPESSDAGVRDTMIVQWHPLAKDGRDLPVAARAERLAKQVVTMGETYDFEYLPTQRGLLRLEVREGGVAGKLLVRVPIRVE
ncbi:MAG TPA: multicopper oxidase domain-containing protein [Gemmatimonadaceae bacterium]|nr:multicopper oxidase domain-containing protein [Gemmatimonadaceae bacterium]